MPVLRWKLIGAYHMGRYMTDVSAILAERGENYGLFERQAAIACDLKGVMWTYCAFAEQLAPDQREALEMIAVKIARIINGNPNYGDNWRDIEGYARLVADRLERAKT